MLEDCANCGSRYAVGLDRCPECGSAETVVALEGDWENETVDDLREHLRARDLPVSGSKAELVARLHESDGGE